MKDQATAAQGLEKYRAERDEINNNIKKLESQKKLGWRIKVVAEQAKLKSINTKIDILKGIENGDKAYAEEKIAQFNIVKNITVNGPKAYFNDIAKPVSSHLNAAWDSATSLNYVDYRSNIDMFWGARVALWNGQYNINSKDAATAIEFNDITNYLTIQTIKSLQGSDTTKAVSLYADANTLAYTVTTLGDLESGIQEKIASPRTAQSICEADLIDIRANNKVSTARNVINGLSDQKTVETILTHLLDKISIGDITVYDLDKLGNNWAIKAAVNAISTTIGSEGVLYVKGHTLMLRPASAVAGPVANIHYQHNDDNKIDHLDHICF